MLSCIKRPLLRQDAPISSCNNDHYLQLKCITEKSKYLRQTHTSHKLLALCASDDVVTQYYAYIKSISRQTCAGFDH